MKGGKVLWVDQLQNKGFEFLVYFLLIFNISVKCCFLSFLYLNCCKFFEVFHPRINIIYYLKLLLLYYSKENVIAKLQKLYSPPRNLRAGNKSPARFLKKPLCTSDLSPACRIFIERSDFYQQTSNFLEVMF